MNVDSCRFCNIHVTNEIKAISDTILYENENFFVVPALGSLVKNYIMIVSKKHVGSMSNLNIIEKRDLEDLINEFRIILKAIYGFYPILFEHGASNEDANKSACCVFHAHVHIVPVPLISQKEMISSLDLTKIESQYDVFGKLFEQVSTKPYIMFMDNSGTMFYRSITDTSIPSQIIRKWIAKDIEQPKKWDWRQFSFDENVLATIDHLKPAIHEHHFKKRDARHKYVYYCSAMDGLPYDEISKEYEFIQNKLAELGRVLVNPFANDDHYGLEINKHNAEMVVCQNLENLAKADCAIVNLSKKDHLYVGCIAEMLNAKQKGCYVIVICGESGVERHFYTLKYSDRIYRTLDELFSKGEW